MVLRRRTPFLILLGALFALIGVTTHHSPVSGAGATTTAFDTLGPIRLVDTRAGGAPVPTADTTIVVPVRSVTGVPADAVAAAVTVVATDARDGGFVTVWGSGTRPSTSALNLDGAGQTRANFAITQIGDDGNIRLYTQRGTHLVVDLTGVFRPAASANAGRLVPLGPTRLVDTRETSNPLAAGETRTIDATVVGVPADADAVVVSFTGIGPAGWFAAWPAGRPWPGTSVVNTEAATAPATASAIVPLTSGRFDLTSLRGGDVVIDVNGYFTGPNAASSTEGLFVPISPVRVSDTRGDNGSMPPIGPAATLQTAAFPFDVANAGSVALNVTTVEPSSDGFLTAYPTGTARPNASIANALSRQVLAAGTITPLSAAGVNVFTQARTHLVVDATGWFVTAPRPVATQPDASVVSTSFKLSVLNPDGSYPRWNPCQDVRVMVNFAGSQPHARAAFDKAIQRAREATGFRLLVTETTKTAPANGEMLVRWGTSVDHPSLTGSVLGIGGFSYSPTQIVRGSVIVRSDLPFTTSKKGEDVLAGTLAHEMGHAFGLSHVNDPTQLMYAYANGLETYQAGDRTGLALLGAGQPCLSFPINRTEGAVPIGVGMDDPIGEVMVIDVAGPDGAHLHDEHDHDHHDEHDG